MSQSTMQTTPATTPMTEPRSHRLTWAPWSALQLVAVALGGFLIVLGALALAETGFGEWTDPRADIWGFSHTPLMAIIEILIGLVILSTAANPFSAKATLFGFGALMVVFGAIVLLDPSVFDEWLGANRRLGLLYAGAGGGAVVLASAVPLVTSR